MKRKYICTNDLCREKNKRGYRLALPDEVVMDDQNIAVIFCPKCKRKLKQIK